MNPLIEAINAKQIPPGRLGIWWIGQAGFAIKSQKLIIYIDPYLSAYAERITQGRENEHIRMNPAPMHPKDVTHADIVLCTHDHADHIDPDGIPAIAQSAPQSHFVAPECARSTLRGFGIKENRIHTLKGDDSLTLKGIRVHAVPAKHEQFDYDQKKGYPYLSYIIAIDGLNLFHSGDTIPYDGQAGKVKKHRIDLAFVPINGRDDFRHRLQFEGNFDCAEAAAFAREINAGLTIPMHYDMFTLNTADVNEFRKTADRWKLNYRIMNHGGMFLFSREAKK